MEKKNSKKFNNAEKTGRGDPLGFNNIHSVAKHQKIEGGPFGDFFFAKSLLKPKKNERGPLGFFSIHSSAKYQRV